MVGFVKLAAASAILAYGVVALSNAAPAEQGKASVKLFHDRIAESDAPALKAAAVVQPAAAASVQAASGKGDRRASDCAAQTWPYISPDCASRADGAGQAKRVRVITIESRTTENTSTLVRMPQTNLAQR